MLLSCLAQSGEPAMTEVLPATQIGGKRFCMPCMPCFHIELELGKSSPGSSSWALGQHLCRPVTDCCITFIVCALLHRSTVPRVLSILRSAVPASIVDMIHDSAQSLCVSMSECLT